MQRQLDRLAALGLGDDTLGLDRIAALLERVGRPQDRVPPVFHVAGTNGKGSTAAVLRAAIEADGGTVHVYSSPHLVRFNERIRLAGTLAGDEALADALGRVLDRCDDLSPSFFEATTAAALLLFAEHPADATIVEVGLGGRLDATNVFADPAACGIATLGLDHQSFLGDTVVAIAAEKAGIARADRPLVTLRYPEAVERAVAAAAPGAELLREGREWSVAITPTGLRYRDRLGALSLAAPALAGAHQALNAGLAVAMLRHQSRVPVGAEALARAPALVRWPARLQRLPDGPVVSALGGGEVWLDGGHNPDAAAAIARWLADRPPVTLLVGLLANKDAAGFLRPLMERVRAVVAVPVAGHESHDPADLARQAEAAGRPAVAAPDLAAGIARAGAIRTGPVLIAGSLYQAGEVLRLNDSPPD